MITAGIDIGARAAKAVILDENAAPVHVIRPINDTLVRLSRDILTSALKQARIRKRNLARIGITGYGRERVKFTQDRFTAPLCLARAAADLDRSVRSVIDLGGLITRVVQVNKNGGVADYIENEKCASGSGRFLEMIAEALELPLERIGPESLTSTRPLRLSSQCVVFAESEVISHVNADEPAADILAGVHRAIADRVRSLAGKIDYQPPVMIVGGVAKNTGVMHFLHLSLAAEIRKPPVDPQIMGALGAALLARDRLVGG